MRHVNGGDFIVIHTKRDPEGKVDGALPGSDFTCRIAYSGLMNEPLQ